MLKVSLKPLSVNECWQGRRFKTRMYQDYEEELLMTLPDLVIPKGELEAMIVLGLSSASGDIDNPIKPLLDIFQKKYEFNDKRISRLVVEKKKVNKGEEFIGFEICKRKTEEK